MKENCFNGYVHLKNVRPPQPAEEMNERGEPMFIVNATGVASCGSVRVNGKFQTEFREIDITFTGLTSKHAEILSEESHIMISNGTVISYDSEIKYPTKTFRQFAPEAKGETLEPEEIISFLKENVVANKPDIDIAALDRQLNLLIPKRRRRTFLRVRQSDWSLKASQKQLRKAHEMDSIEDSIIT